MWADQASHEGPEDWVHSDDAGEEGGSKCDQEREADNALTGTILESTRPAENVDENRSDDEDEE